MPLIQFSLYDDTLDVMIELTPDTWELDSRPEQWVLPNWRFDMFRYTTQTFYGVLRPKPGFVPSTPDYATIAEDAIERLKAGGVPIATSGAPVMGTCAKSVVINPPDPTISYTVYPNLALQMESPARLQGYRSPIGSVEITLNKDDGKHHLSLDFVGGFGGTDYGLTGPWPGGLIEAHVDDWAAFEEKVASAVNRYLDEHHGVSLASDAVSEYRFEL